MADDLTSFLSGAAHALGKIKEARGADGKVDRLSLITGLIEGSLHANQHLAASTGGNHPRAVQFEILLAEPEAEAEQQLYQIAQMTTETTFADLRDQLADYGAVVSDPYKRKRIGLLLFTLGKARGECRSQAHQAHYAPQGRDYAPQQPYPPQPYPPQHYEQPASPFGQPPYAPSPMPGLQYALDPPPHPNEPLFRRFMELGSVEGSSLIARDLSVMDKARASSFFKMFRDYAASLRDERKIKIALALSNEMYLVYNRNFIAKQQIALPAPTRTR